MKGQSAAYFFSSELYCFATMSWQSERLPLMTFLFT
nr:MAG TPA: hypothetical protein [Caudoviricetes sp.]